MPCGQGTGDQRDCFAATILAAHPAGRRAASGHAFRNGSKKFLRRRKVVDVVARDALPVHHRPTNDAVRMANALLLEQVLATGEYMNASRLATQIGVSKNVLSDLLAMLNKPVREIERLLFEVK
ncbi:MAG: hypothetical protein Q3986_01355 [Akkermansia sp.]|nr:hypothetical protein [Akkermansia sp.]